MQLVVSACFVEPLDDGSVTSRSLSWSPILLLASSGMLCEVGMKEQCKVRAEWLRNVETLKELFQSYR